MSTTARQRELIAGKRDHAAERVHHHYTEATKDGPAALTSAASRAHAKAAVHFHAAHEYYENYLDPLKGQDSDRARGDDEMTEGDKFAGVATGMEVFANKLYAGFDPLVRNDAQQLAAHILNLPEAEQNSLIAKLKTFSKTTVN